MRRLPAGLLVALAALAAALLAAPAAALPRFYLEAASPCGTCHVSPQGGGIRNELGWYQESRTGLITFAKIPKSNGLAGGKLFFGGDFRVQIAKLGRPTEAKPEPDRKIFPMQMSVHGAVAPTGWLTVNGGINTAVFAGYQYAGQPAGEVAVQVAPDPKYPAVRAGLIQPSIGIRPDDHTVLLRANASNPRQPFIPPMYGEWGAELSYHPKSWVQAEAGVFSTAYLRSAVDGAVASVAWLGRLTFMPQTKGINTWVGASGYGAGDFLMVNGFVGLGFLGKISLMFEVAQTSWSESNQSTAFAGIAGFSPKPWLHISARGEFATAQAGDQRYDVQQAVVGIQFTPIPFLEIRPEYRYLRTGSYVLGQYALQIYSYF